VAVDIIKATTMARHPSHPTIALDITSHHTHHTQGRRRCMAILHNNRNIPIMEDTPSSQMYLNINLNLA
jgi:hypothetical protein